MTSLWLDGITARTESGTIPNAEVLVVGAGLTGLVTAVLLARGGKRVVVLEARSPGTRTTGNTTAKISLLQGTRLSTIAKSAGRDRPPVPRAVTSSDARTARATEKSWDCPLHGSRFAPDGTVLGGPATHNLSHGSAASEVFRPTVSG